MTLILFLDLRLVGRFSYTRWSRSSWMAICCRLSNKLSCEKEFHRLCSTTPLVSFGSDNKIIYSRIYQKWRKEGESCCKTYDNTILYSFSNRSKNFVRIKTVISLIQNKTGSESVVSQRVALGMKLATLNCLMWVYFMKRVQIVSKFGHLPAMATHYIVVVYQNHQWPVHHGSIL